MMEQFWNERYSKPEMAYGRQPNAFFAEQLALLEPGHLLLPAEGEGRNAVYAATQNWQVQAFDYSEAGRNKALQLAAEAGVTITYERSDAANFTCLPETFEAVALIYAHFPPELRRQLHTRLADCLQPGGTLILEAFHPQQLRYNSGGPKDEAMLYTADLLLTDFAGLEITLLEEKEIVLDEGPFHQGSGYVTRLVATKPKN